MQLGRNCSSRYSFHSYIQICKGQTTLILQLTIRLILPLDCVTPFKHHSTQAMNETPESLYCHLLPFLLVLFLSSSTPSTLPLLSQSPFYLLSFSTVSSFFKHHAPTHLMDLCARGKRSSLSFGEESPTDDRKRERAGRT